MKAEKKFKLALVGSDSMRGREIKNLLNLKKFPAASMEFFDRDIEEEYSKLTQFRDEPKVIHALKEDALQDLDLVFLAADKKTNREVGGLAEKLNFQAIDLSETFDAEEDIPTLVAGINDGILMQRRYPVMANPHPVAIILSHFFHLLIPSFGLAKAISFVLQPASAYDNPGIQELASQSVALLNSASFSKKVFKEQVAFNILSHTETPDKNGFGSSEKRIVHEIRKVLDRPDLPLSLSIIQAPVFHTYSLMIYLELVREAEIEDLENLYKKSQFFRVAPFRESCSASAVSVSGKDEIFIGPIKKEEAFPCGFWVWLVADNLTRGSALNTFEIARKLLLGHTP
ncbi:MAG: Asd/ArgC dimerization domain-containing protein [Candidatus Aminicenantales bacterium]